MPEKRFLFSADDIRVLKDIVHQVLSTSKSTPNRAQTVGPDIEEQMAPEVYVALVTSTIPARSGLYPGVGQVDIYRIGDTRLDGISPKLYTTHGLKEVVYNLSSTTITPDSSGVGTGTGTGTNVDYQFVPVIRDKFGNWLILEMGSGGGTTPSTSTPTRWLACLGYVCLPTTDGGISGRCVPFDGVCPAGFYRYGWVRVKPTGILSGTPCVLTYDADESGDLPTRGGINCLPGVHYANEYWPPYPWAMPDTSCSGFSDTGTGTEEPIFHHLAVVEMEMGPTGLYTVFYGTPRQDLFRITDAGTGAAIERLKDPNQGKYVDGTLIIVLEEDTDP